MRSLCRSTLTGAHLFVCCSDCTLQLECHIHASDLRRWQCKLLGKHSNIREDFISDKLDPSIPVDASSAGCQPLPACTSSLLSDMFAPEFLQRRCRVSLNEPQARRQAGVIFSAIACLHSVADAVRETAKSDLFCSLVSVVGFHHIYGVL